MAAQQPQVPKDADLRASVRATFADGGYVAVRRYTSAPGRTCREWVTLSTHDGHGFRKSYQAWLYSGATLADAVGAFDLLAVELEQQATAEDPPAVISRYPFAAHVPALHLVRSTS
jgi:hypothetical protein